MSEIKKALFGFPVDSQLITDVDFPLDIPDYRNLGKVQFPGDIGRHMFVDNEGKSIIPKDLLDASLVLHKLRQVSLDPSVDQQAKASIGRDLSRLVGLEGLLDWDIDQIWDIDSGNTQISKSNMSNKGKNGHNESEPHGDSHAHLTESDRLLVESILSNGAKSLRAEKPETNSVNPNRSSVDPTTLSFLRRSYIVGYEDPTKASFSDETANKLGRSDVGNTPSNTSRTTGRTSPSPSKRKGMESSGQEETFGAMINPFTGVEELPEQVISISIVNSARAGSSTEDGSSTGDIPSTGSSASTGDTPLGGSLAQLSSSVEAAGISCNNEKVCLDRSEKILLKNAIGDDQGSAGRLLVMNKRKVEDLNENDQTETDLREDIDQTSKITKSVRLVLDNVVEISESQSARPSTGQNKTDSYIALRTITRGLKSNSSSHVTSVQASGVIVGSRSLYSQLAPGQVSKEVSCLQFGAQFHS